MEAKCLKPRLKQKLQLRAFTANFFSFAFTKIIEKKPKYSQKRRSTLDWGGGRELDKSFPWSTLYTHSQLLRLRLNRFPKKIILSCIGHHHMHQLRNEVL